MKTLIFFALLLGTVYGRPGFFTWLDSTKNVAKGVIDSGSYALVDALGKGNAIVQVGSAYASQGFDKAINFTSNVVNTTASISSNIVAGGTQIANNTLGKISNIAEKIDSAMNISLVAPVVKPVVHVGQKVVGGANAVSQTGISIAGGIAQGGIQTASTVGQVGIKGVGGAAAAGTLAGQVGLAGAAAVEKTMTDNLAKMVYNGLSYFTSPSNATALSDLASPYLSGLGFLVNQNSYDAVDQITPYLLQTAMNFWNSFST